MVERLIQVTLAEDDGDSWNWFGLSYASWLVLPRIALQSMPLEWQAKFFAMVREMEEMIEYPGGYTGQFAVTMKNGNKFVKNCLPHYRHNMLPRKM
jgi:hypothetical protein